MPKKTKTRMAAVLIKGPQDDDGNDSIYLMANDEESPVTILGFHNKQEALDYFEKAYHQRTSQGTYEQSMSACINFIFFTPKVIEFDTLEDLVALIKTPVNCSRLSHVSGFFTGFECNAKGRELYASDKATTASLVDEKAIAK